MNTRFDSLSLPETTIKYLFSIADILGEKKAFEFLRALYNFHTEEIEPDFSGMEQVVWNSMRDLELNNNKKRR